MPRQYQMREKGGANRKSAEEKGEKVEWLIG